MALEVPITYKVKGSGQVEKSVSGITDSFKNLAGTLGLVAGVAGAISLGKSMLDAASDLEETTGKFQTVFKGQEAAASAMAKTLVDSYAMSTEESRRYLSSIQDLLVPMGMNSKAAAAMSGNVVKLSADLGSFNNLPTEQVMGDIQSALVGNFETMKKYGVVLNATVVSQKALDMGLASSKDELTAGQKAQASYALMMEGSKAAIGDLARTSGSYANQMKQLTATVKDVSASLGSLLLPIATKVVSGISAMVSELKGSMGGITAGVESLSNVFASMGPVAISAVMPIVNSITNLAQSIFPSLQKEAGGALSQISEEFATMTDKFQFVVFAVGMIQKAFIGFFGAVELGWEGVKAGAFKTIEVVLAQFSKLMTSISPLVAVVDEEWARSMNNIAVSAGKTSLSMREGFREASDAMGMSAIETSQRLTEADNSIIAGMQDVESSINEVNAAVEKIGATAENTSDKAGTALDDLAGKGGEAADKLTKAQQKAADERKKIEDKLTDDINKSRLSEFDYAQLKLDEEYNAHKELGVDKNKLDEWYTEKNKKLVDEQTEHAEKKWKEALDAFSDMTSDALSDGVNAWIDYGDDWNDAYNDSLDSGQEKLSDWYDNEKSELEESRKNAIAHGQNKADAEQDYQDSLKVLDDERKIRDQEVYDDATQAAEDYTGAASAEAAGLDAVWESVGGTVRDFANDTMKEAAANVVKKLIEMAAGALGLGGASAAAHGEAKGGWAAIAGEVAAFGGAAVAAYAGAKLLAKADGGPIMDLGAMGLIASGTGPRSDDVLVRPNVLASRAEYIVNAEATSANLPLLDFINKNKKPFLKFADGGSYDSGKEDQAKYLANTMLAGAGLAFLEGWLEGGDQYTGLPTGGLKAGQFGGISIGTSLVSRIIGDQLARAGGGLAPNSQDGILSGFTDKYAGLVDILMDGTNMGFADGGCTGCANGGSSCSGCSGAESDFTNRKNGLVDLRGHMSQRFGAAPRKKYADGGIWASDERKSQNIKKSRREKDEWDPRDPKHWRPHDPDKDQWYDKANPVTVWENIWDDATECYEYIQNPQGVIEQFWEGLLENMRAPLMPITRKLVADKLNVSVGKDDFGAMLEAAYKTFDISDLFGDCWDFMIGSGLIPGYQHGGDFIANGKMPIMVGENGPERVRVEPLMGGVGGGGSGTTVIINFHGPAMFDEITTQRFARKVAKSIEQEQQFTKTGVTSF